MKASSRLVAIVLLLIAQTGAMAQNPAANSVKDTKPYKVFTSGRQITIKSSKQVSHVMIWTTDGNRVVEQKEINSNSFTAVMPVNRKAFFLMIGLGNGKVYSEKIGIP